jgi:Rha family phage regulatory protein
MYLTPDITIYDGNFNNKPVINSRDLAIFCERPKRHDNFIMAIRKAMDIGWEFAARNIFESSYRTKKNQIRPCFYLTKDGVDATLSRMWGVNGHRNALMHAFDAYGNETSTEVELQADIVIPSISSAGTVETDAEPELETIDNPIVHVDGMRVYATTMDIAAYFQKRHDNVLAAVREIIALQADFGALNFKGTSYLDCQGKERPAYEITKAGFAVVVGGFSGAKALEFRVRYVQRYEEMEEALRSRVPMHPNLPMTYEASLEQLLIEVRKNSALVIANTELKEKVEEQYDSLQKYRDMLDHHGLVLPSDLARSWRINPNVFFDRLFMAGLIFRPRPGKPWVAYCHVVNRGWMVNRLTPYTDPNGVEKSSNQAYLTPRGIEKVEPLFKDASGQGRLMLVK